MTWCCVRAEITNDLLVWHATSDTRPSKLGHLSILYPPYYRGEVKKERVMLGIPVAHARWIGSLLSQLTDDQLRNAFRAADYSDNILEGYVRTLRERINQLTKL